MQRSFTLESTLAGQRREVTTTQDVMESRDKFIRGGEALALEIDYVVDGLEEPLRSTFAKIAAELRRTSQRLRHPEPTPEAVVRHLDQAIAEGKKLIKEAKPKPTYGLC